MKQDMETTLMEKSKSRKSDVPPGYKRTEVGVIPNDWEIFRMKEVCFNFINGGTPSTKIEKYWKGKIPWITGSDIIDKKVYKRRFITGKAVQNSSTNIIYKGDLLVVTRTGVGKLAIAPFNVAISQDLTGVKCYSNRIDTRFLLYYIDKSIQNLAKFSQGTSINGITRDTLIEHKLPIPLLPEQRAIATALSDVDQLIESLDKLIAKKRAIKQATMQQLLTGKRRLPGFKGKWEKKRIEEIADCLDNYRIPLNEYQRDEIPGSYPYCGANGILDYINDFVIDDDIILMAEDGGHFEEFYEKPIAYRMNGKVWVNNHAHILKAKNGYNNGFLFYSLVHKNILPYLASGTRAKLNKKEMYKIVVYGPVSEKEQTAITNTLSDIDQEIEALEQRRDKTKQIKQGMMQELLTGRTRLNLDFEGLKDGHDSKSGDQGNHKNHNSDKRNETSRTY